MTVIELGEVSADSPTPSPRPMRATDIRWVAVALLTVAVLLGVTGSARPEPRGFRTLWELVAAEQFTLDGDQLYVHRSRPAPGLDAYSAADGRLLWSYPLESLPGWLNTGVPGLVLVPTVAQQADGSTTIQDTLALDARSGELRWKHRGEGTVGVAGGVLQLQWDPRGQLVRVGLVRASDGVELWSQAPPGLTTTWTVAGADPARPELFVTGTSGGLIEVRRIADGTLTRTATVPWPSPAKLGEDSYAYLHTTADLLFSVRTDGSRQTLTAFDLSTLEQAWTYSGNSASGVFDCGPLVCIGGGTPEGVRALDPRTGVTRWQSTGWDYARSFDRGRMIAEDRRATHSGVVDVADGRMITEFPPGMVVLDPVGRSMVLLTIRRPDPTGLAVSELLEDNRLVLRGALTQVADQGCQLSRGRLACMVFADGRTRITVMAVG